MVFSQQPISPSPTLAQGALLQRFDRWKVCQCIRPVLVVVCAQFEISHPGPPPVSVAGLWRMYWAYRLGGTTYEIRHDV